MTQDSEKVEVLNAFASVFTTYFTVRKGFQAPEIRGKLRSKEDHRIRDCFGLEGLFKGHPVQHPCSAKGHL